MDWKPFGPHAALLRFGAGSDSGDGQNLAAVAMKRLGSHPPCAISELSAAFDKLLVEFPVGSSLEENVKAIEAALVGLRAEKAEARRVHRVAVRYDGEDLEDVARVHALTVADVIALHCEPLYRVAAMGFSPGFPYLEGLDFRLATPRRSTPRPRITVGAVAIGGAHTGIYSVESPGGWNILGYTDLKPFDLRRIEVAGSAEAAFLFRVGDGVRFEPVEA